MPVELLRSLLLVSVLDREGLRAAPASHADAIVLDLEGIAPSRAEEARAVARQAVAELYPGHRLWVRIHRTSTFLAKDDIRATAGSQVAGYVLPHTLSANHVRYVEALLRDAEAEAGLNDGALPLIAVVESAEGLLNARDIARATPRLVALALDGTGFCADMGVGRTRDGHELQYARSHLAVCARAANLLAIDSAYPFLREAQGLLAYVSQARQLGLHGMFVLTPEQAVTVNAVFRPTPEEVAYAQRLHAAHEEARQRGEEFAHLEGRIIDAPRARRAQRIIELAAAIEAREQQAAI